MADAFDPTIATIKMEAGNRAWISGREIVQDAAHRFLTAA